MYISTVAIIHKLATAPGSYLWGKNVETSLYITRFYISRIKRKFSHENLSFNMAKYFFVNINKLWQCYIISLRIFMPRKVKLFVSNFLM